MYFILLFFTLYLTRLVYFYQGSPFQYYALLLDAFFCFYVKC